MDNVKIMYPGYVMKAFTMSFDDGSIQDKKIISLFNKYGIKGTFFLNTQFNGSQGYMNHLGYVVWCQRPFDNEIAEIYDGFEIGNHTVSHPMIAECDDAEMEHQVVDCSKKLESLTGIPVNGMGYPGNSHSDYLTEKLVGWGIEYGRLASSSYNFELPVDFYTWEPCSHDADPRLPALAHDFVALDPDELKCLYVWGHSYELDKPGEKLWDDVNVIENRWNNFEKFLSVVGQHNDIWYATNLQICRYVNAVRKLEYSDGKIINKSDIDIYTEINYNKVIIKANSEFAF